MWKSQDWKNEKSFRIVKDRRESGVLYALIEAREGRMSLEHDGQVELQLMGMTPSWTWRRFDPRRDDGSDFYLEGTLRNREWKRGASLASNSVYAAGIMVQLSRNRVFLFRTNRRNRCLPGPVLGAPEWGLRVQPASCWQADDVHGVLLSVRRGLGHAVRPLPHERFRWALCCCSRCWSPLGTGSSHPLWSLTSLLLTPDVLLSPEVPVYKEGTSHTPSPSGFWFASSADPHSLCPESDEGPEKHGATWQLVAEVFRLYISWYFFFLTILLISDSFYLQHKVLETIKNIFRLVCQSLCEKEKKRVRTVKEESQK